MLLENKKQFLIFKSIFCVFFYFEKQKIILKNSFETYTSFIFAQIPFHSLLNGKLIFLSRKVLRHFYKSKSFITNICNYCLKYYIKNTSNLKLLYWFKVPKHR